MDKDAPFPALDESNSIPVGLGRCMREARARDWKKRKEPDYWLADVRKTLEPQFDILNVATFVLAIPTFKIWLKSDEAKDLYGLAADRAHRATGSKAFLRAFAAPTAHFYSERGGQQLEALMALGFSLRSGQARHSLKAWRPIESAICREGLGRTDLLGDDADVKEAVDTYFKNIHSRLHAPRRQYGKEGANDLARNVFDALRLAAFGTLPPSEP